MCQRRAKVRRIQLWFMMSALTHMHHKQERFGAGRSTRYHYTERSKCSSCLMNLKKAIRLRWAEEFRENQVFKLLERSAAKIQPKEKTRLPDKGYSFSSSNNFLIPISQLQTTFRTSVRGQNGFGKIWLYQQNRHGHTGISLKRK